MILGIYLLLLDSFITKLYQKFKFHLIYLLIIYQNYNVDIRIVDPEEQWQDQPENNITGFNQSNTSVVPLNASNEREMNFVTFSNLTSQPATRSEQFSNILPQITNHSHPFAPTNDEATYEHVSLIPRISCATNSSNIDYVPQFLPNTLSPVSSSMLPNHNWWMTFPLPPHPFPPHPHPLPLPPPPPPPPPTSSMHFSPVPNIGRIPGQSTSISLVPAFEALHINIPVSSSSSSSSINEHGHWRQLSIATNMDDTNSLLIPRSLYSLENNQQNIASIRQEHEEIEHIQGYGNEGIGMMIEGREHMEDGNMADDWEFENGLECLLNEINLGGNGELEDSEILSYAAGQIREWRMGIAMNEGKIRQINRDIQQLNDKIVSLQASLPSSSRTATSTISQKAEMEQFLERYTKERARQDYRFWVMAKMMQPLMETLIERLSQLPSDRALAETSNWLQANFQLSTVRTNASSMLIYLATHAGMLNDPNALQEYIQKELSQ
uniref:Uncharacterized protein n=2 Tax=Loa loa TaxID=7209 RepID=A0A1I7VYG0_LOALO